MEFSFIFPVVALILGWLLNELSRYLGLRHHRHGAVGQALSRLLAIRDHLKQIQLVTLYATENLQMSYDDFVPEFKKNYRNLFPFYSDLYQNIDDSVSVIASFDPFLASQLYSNKTIGDMFIKLSSTVNANEDKKEDDNHLLNYISRLDDNMLPVIEESILKLSKKQGFFTYFRVKSLFNKKPEIPDEIFRIIEDYQNKFNESQDFQRT